MRLMFLGDYKQNGKHCFFYEGGVRGDYKRNGKRSFFYEGGGLGELRSPKNNGINYMTIHTIGDSHSLAGWPEYVNGIWIGPKLCYSFGRDGLKTFDIRTQRNIQNGDTIIFCFGEIDCRCHIHKYVKITNSYQFIIDNIVEKYFDAIKLNISVSPVSLNNVCVYNVVPPIHTYNTPPNPDYPYLGTDQDRKKYVLYFNEKLKEKCSQNNYIYFDVYKKYADSDGFLIKHLSDGHNHIKDGKYLHDFITEHIGLMSNNPFTTFAHFLRNDTIPPINRPKLDDFTIREDVQLRLMPVYKKTKNNMKNILSRL